MQSVDGDSFGRKLERNLVSIRTIETTDEIESSIQDMEDNIRKTI